MSLTNPTVTTPMAKDKRFYLVAYDIELDRSRTRLAKLLKGFGERVQRSVFELFLDERQFERLCKAGESLLGENDSIRWYWLCESCKRNVRIIGVGKLTEIPDAWII